MGLKNKTYYVAWSEALTTLRCMLCSADRMIYPLRLRLVSTLGKSRTKYTFRDAVKNLDLGIQTLLCHAVLSHAVKMTPFVFQEHGK